MGRHGAGGGGSKAQAGGSWAVPPTCPCPRQEEGQAWQAARAGRKGRGWKACKCKVWHGVCGRKVVQVWWEGRQERVVVGSRQKTNVVWAGSYVVCGSRSTLLGWYGNPTQNSTEQEEPSVLKVVGWGGEGRPNGMLAVGGSNVPGIRRPWRRVQREKGRGVQAVYVVMGGVQQQLLLSGEGMPGNNSAGRGYAQLLSCLSCAANATCPCLPRHQHSIPVGK